MDLIALKTLKQEGDAKVPEENSQAKGMIAATNAREEEQQKAVNLIATKTPEQVPEENPLINTRDEQQQKATNLTTLKTPKQEGDAKVPEKTDRRTGRRRPRA